MMTMAASTPPSRSVRRRRFLRLGDGGHPFDVDVLHRQPRVGEDLREVVYVRAVGLHGDGLAPQVASRSDVALTTMASPPADQVSW